MSFIDNYIEKRIEQNPKLAKGFAQEDFNLNAGVIVRKMRDDLNMTQKEFASYVGKSQATISRIESGSMNVSVGLLSEIANAAHRKIKLVLV
ncbi:helix-turn-helix domain-containing protein [Lactobacillus panisapium]|uniref:Helix-turn-helix transcriptional regulator n=1 Tax=Lactobacillus panisapium TaxID=2012495 RepID=A0ABX8W955_9LACO|nr:helix-turn-helix transcriptional regulator [Lactobacillus panisapium]QYN53445.1 helix-turn-helix transcriptional regulator [Lactobacillus panisapium]